MKGATGTSMNRSRSGRAMVLLAALLAATALAGCAKKYIPPEIDYDDAAPALKLVDPVEWTPWGSEPVQVHVTVPPTGMVSTAGFWLPLWLLANRIPEPMVTAPTGPPPPPPAPPSPLP